jgi:hypothetical protein
VNRIAHPAVDRIRQPAVRVLLVVLVSASSWVAMAQEPSTSNVMVAHGALARTGKAGNLWVLTVTDALRFRDETILEVTFLTPIGDASHAYAPFDGKSVELVGEVKSVFRGNAVLSAIRTIGIAGVTGAAASDLRLSGASTSSLTVSGSATPPRVPYKHAYYLFLAGPPHGCEPCYVPMLITQYALDEIEEQKRTAHGVFMVTYERDSIWDIKGAAPIDATTLEVSPRIIRIGSQPFRYQEITPAEALKLFEHPLGTIPISRPGILYKGVPGASMNELIADFRALASAGRANQK